MNNRILDFSVQGVKLRVRLGQLRIERNGSLLESVPLGDIAVVILANPMITLSQPVLQGLSDSGAVTIICNEKSLPVGLCYPLVGHHIQTNRMRTQALVQKPVLKRLWQQIVRKKIEFQSAVLFALFQDDADLKSLMKTVKSGDTDNREGTAARRYWAKLFGSAGGFRRLPEGDDPINSALNYGYAILRAAVARGISAAGLHPSLGIFHHNKYNPFCLADDLMEPLRPVVDYAVYHLYTEGTLTGELTPRLKKIIIDTLTGRYLVNGMQETLFETSAKIAESLTRVYEERDEKLLLPSSIPCPAIEIRDDAKVNLRTLPAEKREEIVPPF